MIETLKRPITDVDNPDNNRAMMEVDSCYWALCNRVKLMGNTTFTLDGCLYMQAIMQRF